MACSHQVPEVCPVLQVPRSVLYRRRLWHLASDNSRRETHNEYELGVQCPLTTNGHRADFGDPAGQPLTKVLVKQLCHELSHFSTLGVPRSPPAFIRPQALRNFLASTGTRTRANCVTVHDTNHFTKRPWLVWKQATPRSLSCER